MPQLKNCPRCGRVFVYTNVMLCPQCLKEDEQDYNKVRDYLYEHPKATIDKVSRETEVPAKKIIRFLREGRLILSKENVNIFLTCERCDKPIRSGRYCKECAEEFKEKLSVKQDVPQDDVAKTGRMHLDIRRKK